MTTSSRRPHASTAQVPGLYPFPVADGATPRSPQLDAGDPVAFDPSAWWSDGPIEDLHITGYGSGTSTVVRSVFDQLRSGDATAPGDVTAADDDTTAGGAL